MRCGASLALLFTACVAPSPRAALPRAAAIDVPSAAPRAATRVDPASSLAGLELRMPTEERAGFWARAFDVVSRDYEHFYDAGTLLALGAGVGLAGLAANSDFDTEVQGRIRQSWDTQSLDDLSDKVSRLGDFEIMVPATALAAWLGPELGSDAIGAFGERTLRAYLVAAPVALALQRLTGARRPDDPANAHGSEWRFFDSSHGVSGHAVVGSIPFLTIAKLQDDPWIDALCYAASTLAGLARLQEDRHYASQVALGWWIGYLTTEAVDDTERAAAPPATSWMPVIAPGYVGVVVSHRL